jgi:hypothetical protein
VTRAGSIAVLAGLVAGVCGGGAACEPSRAPPSGVALDVSASTVQAGPVDAGSAPSGRCPPDAPWNGRVCLGGGYVACPGDGRLDDAGACQRAPAVDAGRPSP